MYLKTLAKSVLMPLELATDAAIQNKMFGSDTTTLTVCDDQMNDVMKIVKSLEKSDLLIKRS